MVFLGVTKRPLPLEGPFSGTRRHHLPAVPAGLRCPSTINTNSPLQGYRNAPWRNGARCAQSHSYILWIYFEKFAGTPAKLLKCQYNLCLRHSALCNDALDVKRAIHGLEKLLKTGTVASSRRNVQSSSSFLSQKLVSAPRSSRQDSGTVATFMKIAQKELAECCTTTRPCTFNVEEASIVLIRGYLARAANERIPCESCPALLLGSKSDAHTLGPTAHQDRVGLIRAKYTAWAADICRHCA